MLSEYTDQVRNEIGDVDHQDFDEVRRDLSVEQLVGILRLGDRFAAALGELRCRPGSEVMEIQNLELRQPILPDPYLVM